MDREKYIDESWKESVAIEKDLQKNHKEPVVPKQALPSHESPSTAAPSQVAAEEMPENSEVSFMNYMSGLAYQTMVFLGELPIAEDRVEINLDQAKLLIDTLILIRKKTKGNLTKEEENFLNGAIYELQMKYVEHSSSDSTESQR